MIITLLVLTKLALHYFEEYRGIKMEYVILQYNF